LLRRFKVRDRRRILFTDEENVHLNPPVSYQNDRVWARGKKTNVKQSRILVEREKFVKHVMVSAGIVFRTVAKDGMHFVEEKAIVDCACYVAWPSASNLVEDCSNRLLPTGIIFQRDDAPAHTAHRTGCGPTVQIS